MYFRTKRTGKYKYLQIVRSFREGGKVCQRVLLTLGEMTALRACGQIEGLMRSGLRFCERLAVIEAQGKAGEVAGGLLDTGDGEAGTASRVPCDGLSRRSVARGGTEGRRPLWVSIRERPDRGDAI